MLSPASDVQEPESQGQAVGKNHSILRVVKKIESVRAAQEQQLIKERIELDLKRKQEEKAKEEAMKQERAKSRLAAVAAAKPTDTESEAFASLSHRVSLTGNDLSSFNENFLASCQKLVGIRAGYERACESYHDACDNTAQAYREHRTVEDFLDHTEAFQQTQSSEFIAKVIAESRVKLGQLRTSVDVREKEEQEYRDKADVSKHTLRELQCVTNKAATQASGLVNMLKAQLSALEETLSEFDRGHTDADDDES